MSKANIDRLVMSEPTYGYPEMLNVVKSDVISNKNFIRFLDLMSYRLPKLYRDRYPNVDYIPSCCFCDSEEEAFSGYCRFILTADKILEVIA